MARPVFRIIALSNSNCVCFPDRVVVGGLVWRYVRLWVVFRVFAFGGFLAVAGF